MSYETWKIPLQLRKEQVIKLPMHCQFMHVDWKDDQGNIWVIVNTEDTETDHSFLITTFGTGEPIRSDFLENPNTCYIGTYIQSGTYVWHVYVTVPKGYL